MDEAPWWERHNIQTPQTIYRLDDIASLDEEGGGVWRLDDQPSKLTRDLPLLVIAWLFFQRLFLIAGVDVREPISDGILPESIYSIAEREVVSAAASKRKAA